jgi:hypothetical protein
MLKMKTAKVNAKSVIIVVMGNVQIVVIIGIVVGECNAKHIVQWPLSGSVETASPKSAIQWNELLLD